MLRDHPDQSPACLALFQAIEDGRESAWTSDLTIAEVVFVLSNPRYFTLNRQQIAALILPLIALPGIELPSKSLFPRVFEIFTTLPIDFIDSYHAALIEDQQQQELYSYDTDFDRAGLSRLEP